MRWLPLVITGMVLFSGCLDFLDEEVENGAPQASASAEGGTKFEPNQDIVFTGKGSSDPDGDLLEYFWDFDKNDGNEESKIGANNGRITHSYENEGIYTVTLTVSDGYKDDTATVKVTIEETKSDIRAVITTDDETDAKVIGDGKATFTFSASDSVSESVIIKYEWDFSYDSTEGFYADDETTEPEATWDFDSGLYTVKVRITNEEGESDEASNSDDVELRINYEYTISSATISSGQHEYVTQVYSVPAMYIRATLEYDAGAAHTSDLDLYLYNQTQERNPDEDESSDPDDPCNVCVNRSAAHNTSQSEQENGIELYYYNADQRHWFDNYCDDGGYCEETGDWFFVVDHERGSPEYTVRIEVLYWI